MPELPMPTALGLPRGSVVAVPAEGLHVFRLVRSDPPTEADFEPQPARRGRQAGLPEILRVGISHFLSAAGAERVRRYEGSSVARVLLRPGLRIHVARTGGADHVTVWAPSAELLAAAEVVGGSGRPYP